MSVFWYSCKIVLSYLVFGVVCDVGMQEKGLAGAVRCISAMQCTGIHCNALVLSAMHLDSLQFIGVQCSLNVCLCAMHSDYVQDCQTLCNPVEFSAMQVNSVQSS